MLQLSNVLQNSCFYSHNLFYQNTYVAYHMSLGYFASELAKKKANESVMVDIILLVLISIVNGLFGYGTDTRGSCFTSHLIAGTVVSCQS
jgi:hypothetical protein